MVRPTAAPAPARLPTAFASEMSLRTAWVFAVTDTSPDSTVTVSSSLPTTALVFTELKLSAMTGATETPPVEPAAA